MDILFTECVKYMEVGFSYKDTKEYEELTYKQQQKLDRLITEYIKESNKR